MNGLLIFFDGIPQDLDNFNGTESASFVFRRKDGRAILRFHLPLN